MPLGPCSVSYGIQNLHIYVFFSIPLQMIFFSSSSLVSACGMREDRKRETGGGGGNDSIYCIYLSVWTIVHQNISIWRTV